MKTPIIYSPFIDWKLYSLFEKKAKEILLENGRPVDPKKFKLAAKSPLQEFIKSLDFSNLPEKLESFYHAAGAFSVEETEKLAEFIRQNKFSLNVPPAVDSEDGRKKGITVAAVMELDQTWPEEYKAKKEEYEIEAPISLSNKELLIKGYRLSNVGLFRKDGTRVESNRYFYGDCQSAIVELGSNLSIVLTDVSFYSKSVDEFEKHVSDPLTLCQMIAEKPIQHNVFPSSYPDYRTYALLPCLEEDSKYLGNLKDMSYFDEATGDGAEITDSGILSKLRLNEKGVYARSEGWATGHVLITASAHNMHESYTFALIVKMGLVVNILYKSQSIFAAYIPQSCFHKS